ncbi:uncharacterized protein LOC122998795 isoform X1 [Thunnus albacares]|uniref:uncharacterized protein LOC122998795 isoform X1 n=1 Tax=Thunnus albacares TaxID=8236 RepID=UPI001CF65560|nr:uncharacterized protein LOC122998795 isoform X1 [Thunnus albacares]
MQLNHLYQRTTQAQWDEYDVDDPQSRRYLWSQTPQSTLSRDLLTHDSPVNPLQSGESGFREKKQETETPAQSHFCGEIVSGLIKAQSNRRSKADIFLRDDRRAKSNRMEQSLFSQIGLSPDCLPGQNNGGPRSPASPQARARGGRGLGTEGAAQHAEIWRRQIRWQRHREALSHGPKGKFAVIKRKMREIKWLLYSFSQTFLFFIIWAAFI